MNLTAHITLSIMALCALLVARWLVSVPNPIYNALGTAIVALVVWCAYRLGKWSAGA